MITRDDQIKILDFGLAKPVGSSPDDLTRVVGVPTRAGTVIGSSGYIAPEQVRCLEVDHRADIFAFGAVLYEMLIGEFAFDGRTSADTMIAILTKDPTDLQGAKLPITPGLDRIVHRCLEKSPDLRFQSANDLAFALETVSTVSTASSGPVQAAAPVRHSRAWWLPWTVAALAIAAAAVPWLFKAGSGPEGRWESFTRITEAAGEETSPTLSPDGGTVAYSMRVNGSWDIYSQRVGGRNATPIVNDPQRDEGGPAFRSEEHTSE